MTNPELIKSPKEEYYYEGGRRFNSNVRYVFPSDKKEKTRLVEQHLSFKNLQDGKNYLAPVKQQLEKGISVLDSACGNGASWTVEMAKEYPNSQFLGVDISDGFPAKEITPLNAAFSIGNIAKAIPSPDNTFGFVYQRLLFVALSSEEWNSNLREIYRVTKPGGFVELVERNLTPYRAGPLFTMLCEIAHQSFKKAELVFLISIELNNRLKDAGFINCVTKIIECPLNYGENGYDNWRPMRDAFESVRPLLSKNFTEWEDENKYNRLLEAVSEELTEYKTYNTVFNIYAQKPLDNFQK